MWPDNLNIFVTSIFCFTYVPTLPYDLKKIVGTKAYGINRKGSLHFFLLFTMYEIKEV